MRLLCLSNGHGEDAIAIQILQELQQLPNAPEIAALPLVGEGNVYRQLEIPIVGPAQTMPSGGFIYMDGKQLARDVRGGLLQLTWAQFQAIRQWAKTGGSILAVGDIVPLLFAWLSGAPYAFVGTAKSEYYLRDEEGILPRKTWRQQREGKQVSVYFPWERWLMKRQRCKAIFPRDKLTAETLQKLSIPAFDLGNPMMDGIEPDRSMPIFYDPNVELKETQRSLIFTLLPGSRPPEAYQNWQLIVEAANGVLPNFRDRSLIFLGAIAPSLSLDPFREVLIAQGWEVGKFDHLSTVIPSEPNPLVFQQKNAVLILSQRAYNDCLNQGDVAIAMAGTATEQFVGLGKPAIAIPGKGPQFNPVFAEAQSRLLGPSLILADRPDQVSRIVQSLLRDPDRLQLIAENGRRRLGEPGAAKRIATCLMERF